MNKETQYFSGTVESFDDRRGYGFITADESDLEGERLLVHRRSLSDSGLQLNQGTRVYFQIREVPSGKLAYDVTPILTGNEGQEDPDDIESSGVIERYFPKRGYGIISLENGKSAFFHISNLEDSDWRPAEGAHVRFALKQRGRGLEAYKLNPDVVKYNLSEDIPPTTVPDDILARAILSRDSKQYDEAVRLYEIGMRKSPTVQIVLSYAAMEKNRNRKDKAMLVYERGIALFPKKAKLYEDAGILAGSLGEYDRATKFLSEALDLCDKTGQAGQRGILLAMARNYNRIGTRQALINCVECYESAVKLFTSAGSNMPQGDRLIASLARIRLQHHRGNLSVTFFQQLGIQITRADLMPNKTVGAALVVNISNPELEESYGLSGPVMVHSIFKSNVSIENLKYLDAELEELGGSALVDDQLAFIIVASIPTALQRILFKRLEQRTGGQPAIIPISQQSMETEKDAKSVFRNVLDQWLYRRDLFATNAPVSGKRFFGRDKALAELREAIQTAIPTGVFGLRKVGKTSLLKETVRRANEAGDIAIYVDLLRVPEGISDTRWLYWNISNLIRNTVESRKLVSNMKWRLCGLYPDYFDLPTDLSVAAAFDSDITRLMKKLVESKLSPTPRIALLLDEVERLLPTSLGKTGFRGFFDFFSYLRGISQETDGFVLIVTGANNIIGDTAHFDGRDNPVFNFFHEVYLQLLSRFDCAYMIKTLGRGMGIKFTEEACNRIHYLTGGHPFFARQLCSFISKRFSERPLHVNAQLIGESTDHYLEAHSRDFQEIIARINRDFPEELDLCELLAAEERPVPMKQIREILGRDDLSLRHLEGYQLIQINGDEIELSMDLFRRWLKKGA
jgi:cold shock CspA family protein